MIFNLDTRFCMARNPRTALRYGERMRGMIGRRFDAEMDCMVFPGCRSIHTFFMGIRIDAVFLDRESKVVGLARSIRPWKPVIYCGAAVTTLEFPDGLIDASGTEIGHRINWNANLTAEAIDKLQCGEYIN